jgi:hypothetical protein
VSGVIAGTVRRSGERLRVTVQLSSAADGFQRWSHEYERRSSDVFAVQDELTSAIVAEPEPTLRGAVRDRGQPRLLADARSGPHPAELAVAAAVRDPELSATGRIGGRGIGEPGRHPEGA